MWAGRHSTQMETCQAIKPSASLRIACPKLGRPALSSEIVIDKYSLNTESIATVIACYEKKNRHSKSETI